MSNNTRPIGQQRRWSSAGESVKNEMSKKKVVMTPSNMPMESSPQSKRFRLFKRKSTTINKSRRRSQSLDEIPTTATAARTNIPPTAELLEQQDLKKLKLRITIEEARHLALDTDSLNTYSIVRCLNQRNRTQVVKKSSQPKWQCTFDIPVILINSKRKKRTRERQWRQGIIITICSKDRFRSQVLGQIQLPFEDVAAVLYHDINNNSNWHPLNNNNSQKKAYLPRRRAVSESTGSLGEIRVKIGLVLEGHEQDHSNVTGRRIKHMWKVLTAHHHYQPKQPSLYNLNSPAMRSSSSLPPEIGFYMPSNNNSYNNTATNSPSPAYGSDYFSKQHYKSQHRRQISGDNLYYATSPPSDASLSKGSTTRGRLSRATTRRKKKNGLEGKFHQDVVGVTFLEICHAKDLPPERNLARTSFDMDPFVVVSYGTSTFRTSAVRHNLNPVWNEKLFFHVRHNEANYHLKFTVYDREKFSGNDLVAWYQIPIKDVISSSQQQQDVVELHAEEEETESSAIIEKDMDRHTFPLQMVNPDKWKNKRPTLTIRAKFMPYDQIRKMFWMALAKNYDVESTGTLSRLEVQSMLETIGSTITESTINKFWEKNNKNPKNENDELTIDQLVDCLEDHILADVVENYPDNKNTSTSLTPDTDLNGDGFDDLKSGLMHMNIHDKNGDDEEDEDEEDEDEEDEDEEDEDEEDEDEEDEDEEDEDEEDEDEDWAGINDEEDDDDDDDDEDEDEDDIMTDALDNLITTDEEEHLPFGAIDPEQFDYSAPPLMPPLMEADDVDLAEALIEEEDEMIENSPPFRSASITRRSKRGAAVEKVICLKECPICHRPNLARRSQMDIITHVATCAANDWTTVDRFLMGNFLTEAYAQRRWFVKLVRKVGYGKYSLGRDNANIIIQDRNTGQLIEEKMSVYVRLGMRLVYKGMKTGIQSKGAQRILTNLTMKQGRRFDSPNSVREIPAFIKFHNISLHEVWKPVSSFKTFNDFFYRKLRPGSRPPDSPEDPTVAVSPADSRMTAFESVGEASRIWIKGIEFSLRKLLGDPQSAKDFEGGSLAVFRLAPQDYHRFHSPVDGMVTKFKHISGQYYTVNPMAIRTTIDVFGENTRTIVWIESKEFGKVAVVCVGAMLVGSIIITAKVGSEIKRADEMGYFAFGGSTLIVVFQKDKMSFDHDLLNNSDKAVETLVRVGDHIGGLSHTD